MSIELILNAVNINLVAFCTFRGVGGPGLRAVRHRRRRRRGRRRARDRAAHLPQPTLHRHRRARRAEGLSRYVVLHPRLDHPCAHGAVVPADPALRQAPAAQGLRDRHRVRRRRVRARAAHRRQLDRLAGGQPRGHRRGRRGPGARRGRPDCSRVAVRGQRRSERGSRARGRGAQRVRRRRVRGGRPRCVERHRRVDRGRVRRGRRAPAADEKEPETITRPVARCVTWFDNGDSSHHHRHAGRRPVGAAARGRHPDLAAGAHLLDRLRRAATVATPTTSPSCRCSPPRCCSSCSARTRCR